ncbi:MAG: sigma-70 family RNA polymerase sigma factor [Planctomycetes bacterium]|nr:sigma-70 family RNA polymerase sigma factor [Planctomycetota bacterium]
MAATRRDDPGEEDARLVQRVLGGDHSAYGQLVEKYQRVAVGFAYGVLGDPASAEDAAQEGFIRAFQALGRLDKPERFLSWLRTIIRNSATDFLRRRQRTISLDEMAESGYDPASVDTEKPVDELAEEERLRLMQKILNGLRADYREIVVLRYGEDMSYKEIAAALDMKVSAVGEKLSRVRGILKEKAGQAGLIPKPRDAGGKED